jgi:hypothetical protein
MLTVSAIIVENFSQAFKKRIDCEGGGVWKDAILGFYSVCVCVCVFVCAGMCMCL